AAHRARRRVSGPSRRRRRRGGRLRRKESGMRGTIITIGALAVLSLTRAAPAIEPDAETIARVTGRTPEIAGGVAKISAPRADLAVRVGGVPIVPFQGLTSWAAFRAAG